MEDLKREINLRFQARWIIKFSLACLVSSGALYWILRRFLDHQLSQKFSESFYAIKNMEAQLLPVIGFAVIFYLVMVSFLAIIVVLFLSHSIAGPIFRLEMAAEALQNGDLKFSTKLRQGDQLGGLARAFGALQAKLRGEIQAVDRHFERVDVLWETLDNAKPHQAGAEADGILGSMEKEIAAIRQGLGKSAG